MIKSLIIASFVLFGINYEQGIYDKNELCETVVTASLTVSTGTNSLVISVELTGPCSEEFELMQEAQELVDQVASTLN